MENLLVLSSGSGPQVEALLASEDYGKDLASVNNLLKKHQLLEADISAHEVLMVLMVLMVLDVAQLVLREQPGPASVASDPVSSHRTV